MAGPQGLTEAQTAALNRIADELARIADALTAQRTEAWHAVAEALRGDRR